jgi:hypothetical protein
MKQLFVGLATTALVSGGLGLAGLGLTAGTAHADAVYTWCPGMNAFYPQDMQKLAQLPGGLSVCQHWYTDAAGNFVAGDPGPGKPPLPAPGPPPPPPPPANPAVQCAGAPICLPGL